MRKKIATFQKFSCTLTAAFLVLSMGLTSCKSASEQSNISASAPTSTSQAAATSSETFNSSVPSSAQAVASAESSNSPAESASIFSESRTSSNLSVTPPKSSNFASKPSSTPTAPPSSTVSNPTTVTKPKTVEQYVDQLSLEKQVAQLFFARCPASGAVAQIKQYAPGGYILFARDFENQTPASLKKLLQEYQNAASTPMLIGVDEEGGTVVRASKYKAFRSTPFLSPAEIYNKGGHSALTSDTKEKDQFLKALGIQVNLAPVCDVTTNPNDYIYKRTLGKSAQETAACIQTIVSQMKADGMGCVLKHFPGYGSNVDTHTGVAMDERSLESFRKNDFLPFIAGINAGAGGVLVNHNIVKSMDAKSPASLSAAVHSILRNELKFNGVIMTDDLSMSAITKYTNGKNAAVSAVLAGNDLLISSDFVNQYQAVLAAVKTGTITKAQIRASVIRIIRWKMALGLIKL